MPTVARTDNADLTTTLSVKISKEEFAPQLEKELKKLRNSVAIKGFRPGQAPMPLVKKWYGNRMLLETVNEMTVKELENFIKENQIETLLSPIPSEKKGTERFDITQLEDYEFHFDLAHQPVFEIKGLSQADVYEKMVPADLDALIDEDIKFALRRTGERTNPTDGIQPDDVVKIAAVELAPDGSHKEGGVATTMSCYIPNIQSEDLKKLILSKKTGDSFTFNPRELDSFTEEGPYRKYILNLEKDDQREVGDLFEGTIAEVSRLIPAELGQDFYDKYFGEGAVSSEAEAREKAGENIKRHYSTQADALAMRDMQARLIELNDIPLPTDFIKRYMLNNREEDSLATPEMIDAQMPGVVRQFRWDLVRGKLIADAKIEVTNADMKAAFMRRVQGYFAGQGMSGLGEGFMENMADKLMEDKEQRKEVRDSILYDKLFAEMAARVTIKEKPVPSAQITAAIKAANQEAGADD